MEIKQALAILNLKHDACLEDARDSFRHLAKQYHPDKLNINDTAITGLDRMQDINLAFHLLKKTLKSKKVFKQKQDAKRRTEHRAKNSSSPVNFTAFLKKIKKSFLKSVKKRAGQAKREPSRKFKSTNRSNESKNFDSVLNKTIQRPTKFKQKYKTEITYSKYMELKQKMRSKRKHTKVEGFSPIEKISPISPIKKI